jgi:DNA-binding response OmpR family regulator
MSRRIAILDDSPTVRLLVSKVLGEAGCEVHACESFQQLKERLQSGPLDLVLLDVEMPDIVGDHIGYVLKRGHPELRIVFLSDLEEATLKAMCERTGVDGFIRKRTDFEELKRDIVAHLPAAAEAEPPG